MSAHLVEIESTSPHTQRITIDGVDISESVRRSSIRVTYGDGVAIAELGLIVGQRSNVKSAFARVEIDQTTHDLLVALGWTPPGGEGIDVSDASSRVTTELPGVRFRGATAPGNTQ